MTLKAVLFDIDGTLVDSNDQHVLAWQQVFGDAGMSFGLPQIHEQIGKGADMLVPALLPGAGEAQQEAMGAAHGEIFKNRYLDQVRPFAGARDLLVRAHSAGLKVVLASSASQAELEHYLDLLDARELVAATTSADDVEHTKPAPDIFAAALERLAPLRPDELIVVGDTPYDVAAAAKCGIRAIGLRSGGFPDASLLDAGAVALYDDVEALLDRFEESALGGVEQ
jgi:membrane protein